MKLPLPHLTARLQSQGFFSPKSKNLLITVRQVNLMKQKRLKIILTHPTIRKQKRKRTQEEEN